ncbi:MAG: porin [Ferruginibacter sp.]
MKKFLFSSLLFAGLISSSAHAQVSFGTGDNNLEIGGVISAYLNYRPLKAEETDRDKNKNRYKLRDARFYLEGHNSNKFEYKLQVDFANIGVTTVDPESPALYDAWFMYKAFKPFYIKIGYQDIPYSRSSMTATTKSVYWQRPEISRGELFSRHDVGITLQKSLWNQRINAYLGMYTGTGELFYQGDNDKSGAFEYVGRLDIAYPSRFRYQDFDPKNTPVPMFAIGVNGRYTKRDLPAGQAFIDGESGTYGVKVVDGKKLTLGADAAFQYKGFNLQFETQQVKGTPNSDKDVLLRGLPKELTDGYFKSGGWYGQLSYYVMPLKTILSARYEEFDINDLEAGNSKRFGGAIAYILNGSRTMIKAQYFHIQKEDPMDPQTWKNQFRIGIQLAFE